MTLSITTLSIKGLFLTLSTNDAQHDNTVIILSVTIYCNAENRAFVIKHIRLLMDAGT